MAECSIQTRIVRLGPHEVHVMVSAVPEGGSSKAHFRQAVKESQEAAEVRRGFLTMSLATELRAMGHTVKELVE